MSDVVTALKFLRRVSAAAAASSSTEANSNWDIKYCEDGLLQIFDNTLLNNLIKCKLNYLETRQNSTEFKSDSAQ